MAATHRKGLPFVGALLVIGGVIGCAKVESPSGGPEDRAQPRVIGMTPDSGRVGVLPDTISILFSKKMNRSAVRDWTFLSPPLDIAEKAWRKNRYDLILRTPPDSGKTYTVLLGTEVVDRRAIALGPWVAPFATGASLDDGAVEGEVRGGRLTPAGAYLYVWAWSDSVPSTEEIPAPLRMGQCAKDGKFRLAFLPRGVPLRVCALHDNRHDRSFDAEDDVWGCAEEPIVLSDTSRVHTGLTLYLVLDDEPGVLKGTAVDSSCAGAGASRLIALRREADSLAVVLGVRAPGDSLVPDTLLGFAERGRAAVDSAVVRSRLAAIDSLRVIARGDSARCARPIIVRLFEPDTTLVTESSGDGRFDFRDVAPGIYRIRAFRDLDGDGVAGAGEPSGGFPHSVEVLPGRTLADLDFMLRPLP